jgi:mRNA interferase MazF
LVGVPGPRYVPAQSDIVWLRFDPQAGSEQAGRRPALVVSPRAYNAAVGLALVCPIASQAKGYPFEVPLPETGRARGVVLSDQLKSLDWRVRKAERLDGATEEVMREVIARITTLTELRPGG